MLTSLPSPNTLNPSQKPYLYFSRLSGELTPRTALSLLAITTVTITGYTLAALSVFPKRPYLRPLAWLLATLALWSCYATIRRSSLVAVRAASSAHAIDAPQCTKCPARRPPRAHHCKVCRLCTPRMSHHCGVLGTCIGAHNYKTFVLLLFYGAVAAILLVTLCGREAVEKGKTVWLGKSKLTVGLVLWFQLYYMQYNLAMGLGSYFIFHIYIIAFNRTLLEACTLNSWRTLLPPWSVPAWPYDKGIAANFAEVFGSPRTALLPIIDSRVFAIN